jgi:hypothetical protein
MSRADPKHGEHVGPPPGQPDDGGYWERQNSPTWGLYEW